MYKIPLGDNKFAIVDDEARIDNRLGIKGIRWIEGIQKYEATIKVNYKKIHLGYFKILEEAIRSYEKASEKYFGEFACAG